MKIIAKINEKKGFRGVGGMESKQSGVGTNRARAAWVGMGELA